MLLEHSKILVLLYHNKNTKPRSSTVWLKNSSLKGANLCLYVSYNIRKSSCYESKILVRFGADKLKFEMKSDFF